MNDVDWNKLSAEVEAVARAIYAARIGNSRTCYEFDQLSSEGQHHVYGLLIIEAKAAIQALAFPAIKTQRDELTNLLNAVERKLSSYVGVCSGDKELTHAFLPNVRAALGKGRPNNCRMAQKERGEAYPRSGCDACCDGGLRGCPYAAPTKDQTND